MTTSAAATPPALGSPIAAWSGVRLATRRHDDVDLVLWCAHGTARVNGRSLAAGWALLVPAGVGHVVESEPGTVLHSILLPAAAEPDGVRLRPTRVTRGEVAALLALQVAQATELRPSSERLTALEDRVREHLGAAGGRTANRAITARPHVDWVTNPPGEHVSLLAMTGEILIALRYGASSTTVAVPEHLALEIPPGVTHRVLAGNGVALPVFHPRESRPADQPDQVQLSYLPAATRRLASAHFVADTTLLRPPDWDDDAMDRALSALLQRVTIAGPDGSPPTRVHQLLERVIRDPGGDASPATTASELGCCRRSLERDVRAETGLSFVTWRNLVRAEQAVDLLDAGLPVKAVAHRMGFAHASGFSRAFTTTTGASPRRSPTNRPGTRRPSAS